VRVFRRFLVRRRRLIAAFFAAAAMGCALLSLRPGQGVPVLAAARDLSGGSLGASDVTVVHLPPGALPGGVFRPGADVMGRRLAGPMRRGEPLTDARLLGPGLLAAYAPGLVATPVRITDAEAAGLLSPGDVIDVLAAPSDWTESSPAAQPVARNVSVITTPEGKAETGALVVLATTTEQAAQLATAQSGGRLSVAIHPRQ
jgi:Flp pilus assembly protein CpaB